MHQIYDIFILHSIYYFHHILTCQLYITSLYILSYFIATLYFVHTILKPLYYSCMLKQSVYRNLERTFAASILRPLHQVYQKILNYINENMYLPRIVPLKWDVEEFGVCGKFLAVRRGW